LVVLLAIAAIVLYRSLASPAAAPALAALAPSASAAPVPVAQLDPRLHMEALDRVRGIEYTGAGRDLFHFGSTPALAAPASLGSRPAAHRPVAPTVPLPPPGPPPPPPIPLRFYGFAQASGMPEKIFLQLGEDNYVVSQGDIIEHRYRIESIGKVSVRVKDLLTQSVQDLPLQQG
ncbi:MAG: hypothetical protein ACRD2D_12405, partial [Terriglobales bacterium]